MPLGYQTKQQQIAISGVADLSIRSLLDRQQYFDPDGLAEHLGISSAAWPMFGLLWPSGVQLAARMALRPLTANERVLEVGCGLALASLVSHRRGVDITASDSKPPGTFTPAADRPPIISPSDAFLPPTLGRSAMRRSLSHATYISLVF